MTDREWYSSQRARLSQGIYQAMPELGYRHPEIIAEARLVGLCQRQLNRLGPRQNWTVRRRKQCDCGADIQPDAGLCPWCPSPLAGD